ncbi:unnamed protein product [Eruca vesicaria subsp. sativa]|uniref:GATA-type domain-containing protein n=1 Tax=Eruca vesicaria subsp. sativa TaxID=29727 RepID=A0ABC8JPK4_ERUVS|nr:unnamed protein product [Eruca vesicaria subsp. sativa]
MESFMDELLNFSVPEDEGAVALLSPKNIARRKTGLRQTESFGLLNPDDDLGEVEEELEWISNKDAFPVIETFVDVLPSEHFAVSSLEREAGEGKQLSPVSVLETSSHNTSITTTTTTTTSNNSSGSNGTTPTMISCCAGFNAPVKTRSKRRRRDDLRILWTGNYEQGVGGIHKRKMTAVAAAGMGRKCQHCGADKTPQWRAGPSGPKTLCNACGVRYKSGRLVPEYRPANSPTFSPELHSNSHRKIVEMRKQVVSGDGGGGRKDCG